MAFTDDEKARIRFWLGYPATGIVTSLENAMDAVGSKTPTAAIARELLADLEKAQRAIKEAMRTAGFSRAEDVQWFPSAGKGGNAAVDAKVEDARRLCAQLSSHIGVPLLVDVFGTGGFPSGASNTMGGPILLG
jgi:hypothetical protein